MTSRISAVTRRLRYWAIRRLDKENSLGNPTPESLFDCDRSLSLLVQTSRSCSVILPPGQYLVLQGSPKFEVPSPFLRLLTQVSSASLPSILLQFLESGQTEQSLYSISRKLEEKANSLKSADPSELSI